MRLISIIIVALLLAPTTANAALVALFRFDDSTNLGLESISGNNAVNNGGVSFLAAGRFNGAASFNGANQFLRAPIDLRPFATPNMTWGAWVRPSDTSGVRGILSTDNGEFDRSIEINQIDALDPFTWASRTGGSPGATGVTPSTTDWTFLAASYDQGASTMTFYIDAAEFTVPTFFNNSGTVGNPPEGAETFFDIGQNPQLGASFVGAIDSVFVFDETLDSAAIAAIRNGQTTIPEPSSLCIIALVGCGLVARRQRSL